MGEQVAGGVGCSVQGEKKKKGGWGGCAIRKPIETRLYRGDIEEKGGCGGVQK